MGNDIKPGMMKYCVIGNIVMEHPDKDGITRYGTASFPGGRKVYISRRLWGNEVVVLGLNRHKSRYTTETVPLAWIDNIRFSKTFDPKVLDLMRNTDEFPDITLDTTVGCLLCQKEFQTNDTHQNLKNW